MAASGLLLGPETYAVVAASYGRAGAWDKVLLHVPHHLLHLLHLFHNFLYPHLFRLYHPNLLQPLPGGGGAGAGEGGGGGAG